MRNALSVAAVLAAIAVSPALAQTTPPTPPKTDPAPAATMPNATPPVPAAPGATAPGSVLQPNAATALPPPKVEPSAPLAGANSFTESQAKARIEAKGFSNVSGLKKDDGSIWRGTAMKDGKSVSIALDYQGNVVAN